MLSVLQVTIPSVLCFIVPSFAVILLSKVIITDHYRRSFAALSWSAILSLALVALLAGVVGFEDHSKAEQVILTCLYTELGASVIYLSFNYTCATPWLIPYTLSLSLSLFCVSITCFAAPYIPPLPPLVPPIISLLFTLFTLPLILYPIYSFLSTTTKFRRTSRRFSSSNRQPRGSKIAFPMSALSSTASLPQPPPHIYTASLASLSTLPPKSPMTSGGAGGSGGNGLEAKAEESGTTLTTTVVSGSIPLRRYPCRSDSQHQHQQQRHRHILTGREMYYLQEKRARKLLFALLTAQLLAISSGVMWLAIAGMTMVGKSNSASSASSAAASSSDGAINTTHVISNIAILRVFERAFMVLGICGVIFAYFLHGIPLERGHGSCMSLPPVTRTQDHEEDDDEEEEEAAGFTQVDSNLTKPEAEDAGADAEAEGAQQQLSPTSAVTPTSTASVHFFPSTGEANTTTRGVRSCTIKLPPSGLRIFTSYTNTNNNTGGVVVEDKQGESSPQYARHRRFDSTSSSFSSPRLKRTPIITCDTKDNIEPTAIDAYNDNDSDEDDGEEFELPVLTKNGPSTTMTTATQLPSPPDTPLLAESTHHQLQRESWPRQTPHVNDETKKDSIWFGKYNSSETLLEKKQKKPRRQTLLSIPSSFLPGSATSSNPRPSPKLPSLPQHSTTATTTTTTSPHKRSMSSLSLPKTDWYPFISNKVRSARSYSTIIGGGGGGRESNTEKNGVGGGGDGGGGSGDNDSPERADFVDLTDPFASPPPPDMAKLSRENLNDFSVVKGKMRASAPTRTGEEKKRKETKKNSLASVPASPPSPSCYRDSQSSSSSDSGNNVARGRSNSDDDDNDINSSRNSRRTSSQSTTTTIRRKGSPLPFAFRSSSSSSSVSLTQPPSPSFPSSFPSSHLNVNWDQRRTVSEGNTPPAVTVELLNVDEMVLAQRLLTRLDSVCRDGYF